MTILAYVPIWSKEHVNIQSQEHVTGLGNAVPAEGVGVEEEEDRGTNKCLVKQLLCLYPFPQCWQ